MDVLPITNESRVLDTSCGSGGFLLHALDKVRRQAGDFHPADSVAFYRHWHDFAQSQLYGIEINEQIARTAKMNMIIRRSTRISGPAPAGSRTSVWLAANCT